MRIAAIALALSLALVSACSGPAGVQAAEAKIAAFHDNLDKGNFEAVWNDSSSEITRTESKEALVGLLSQIHGKFGNVKETEQTGWKVNYNNGVSTTEVTMNTTFDKGTLEEQFLFRSDESGMKLAGYKFQEK